MVLSHSDPTTNKHAARINDISVDSENGIEILITVDDKNNEHNVSSTTSIEQEIAVDAHLDRLCLVELTFQQQGGQPVRYSVDSMSPEEQSRLLQTLTGKSLISSRGIRCQARRIRRARKYRQRSVQFDGSTAIRAERRAQQYADSPGSSFRSSARSDMEDGSDDSASTNKPKRAKKASAHSTKTLRESRPRSIRTIKMEDCSGRLMLADDAACSAFYRRVLTDAQQDLCKKLGKWWIRAINPNKQSNHPYAGGSDKKPDWWPLTPPNDATGEPSKGTLDNGFVRHKEPDHLSKSERLVLLPYILVQVVDPRNSAQFNNIDALKLEQISLDSINNETTIKNEATMNEKHESWKRFVTEIFRVAKMQERYKSDEIDDTAYTSVRPSYDSWRHVASSGEAAQDSTSDGIYEEDDDHRRTLPSEVSPGRYSVPQDQTQSEPARKDTAQDYSGRANDARFLPQRPVEASDQRVFQLAGDGQIHMPNQLSYISSISPMSRSEQQPNLLSQEPFRRHSDSSNQFLSHGSCHSNLLPSSNVDSVTNFQYQSIPAPIHIATTLNNQNGLVLPLPLSTAMARSSTDISHFSAFYDNGYCPRLNVSFPTSVREDSLINQHNAHQLTQQPQIFQDYGQEYGDKSLKVHNLNVNNPVRPSFMFEQENPDNDIKPKFGYESKSRCNIDSDTLNLEEMVSGTSNGHGETEHQNPIFRSR